MRKILLILLILTLPAYAGELYEVDTSVLTPAQIAQIKADAAKLSALNTANKEADSFGSLVTDPNKAASVVSTWGTQTAAAAKGFAEALGVAAHALNINVNEFLNTPAGKLTAFVIIWKVAGANILRILLGILIICVGYSICRRIFRGMCFESEEPVESKWFFGLYTTTKYKTKYKSLRDINGESDWIIMAIGLIIFIGSLAAGTALITH